MQRPIEFRIWDKEENSWLDARVWYNANSFFHINESGEVFFFRTEAEGRFVIQQFTGILDKNGKKIFEGDIVRLFDFNGGIFRKAETVVFRSACFCFETDCRSIGGWNLPIEVIGNIFENSELLK